MTWTSPLQLSTLPLVLAGPMLRKVTEKAVTVWFALKQAATVTVVVSNSQGPLLTGTGVTCAVGTNLHIVAVTANKIAPTNTAKTLLGFGNVYFYDATFAVGSAGPIGLGQATTVPGKPVDPKLAHLAYPPYSLPSFSLPPNNISKLRLIQGSCRHPNGTGGPDCLAMLDDLIAQVPTDADLRPHQLVMGGDQIYADDVAGHLLMALTAASDLLLVWQELLQLPSGNPVVPGNRVPPYTRKTIGNAAGITSAESYNHLFTLGEYICMYLFCWSDVLWTVDNLPKKADLVAAAGDTKHLKKIAEFYALSMRADEEFTFVRTFRETLPKVRRALANIPSYMILDDHDVTDDFNMTTGFCKKVYTDPLGLQIVQNALAAYSLCQHWGNAPELFFRPEDAPVDAVFAGKPAGRLLLDALDGVTATTYADATKTATIRKLVGVHTFAQMSAPPAAVVGPDRANWLSAYHDPGSLLFDYTIESPTHQIIVTDTRTWRSFRPGNQHSELLPLDQIQRQIVNVTPATDARTLMVVLTTNAPPVPGIRQAADSPGLATFLSEHSDYTEDNHPDIFEAWELPSVAFDRLVGAISTRLQPFSKIKTGSAIILSGDVHTSFASRLLVQGANPLGAAIPTEQVNVVIAQLVASSFRNLTGKTLSQHKKGYSYPSEWVVGSTKPEGYFGWVSAPSTGRVIGFTQTLAATALLGGVPTLIVKDKTITKPGTLGLKNLLAGGLTVAPDYKYRLDYLTARKEHAIPSFTADPLAPLPPGPASWQTLSNRAEHFRQIAGNYRRYDGTDDSTREMVGENNICELTFDGAKTAFHTVRWFANTAPKDKPPVLTPTLSTYEISLDPTDAKDPFNDLSKVIPAVVARPKGGTL
jgi:hypothetical protein